MRFLLLLAVLALPCCAAAGEVQMLDLNRVSDINASGAVIGWREVTEVQHIISERAVFAENGRRRDVPIVPGFTNVEPKRLSDSGLVVGYASREFGHAEGSLIAFSWNSKTGELVALPRFEGHNGSIAFDVSGDGKIICGYTVASAPARMLPCIWELRGDGWKCSLLNAEYDYNPFLLTSTVVISDSGERIAACLTVDIVEGPFGPRYISHMFEWKRAADGSWQREKRLTAGPAIADINDSGLIAGRILTEDGRRGFVLTPQGEVTILPLLEGDASGEALGLNNKGIVVGLSDDPRGPGGPQAITWKAGELKALPLGPEAQYSAATCINDKGDIAGYLEPGKAAQAESIQGFVKSAAEGL